MRSPATMRSPAAVRSPSSPFSPKSPSSRAAIKFSRFIHLAPMFTACLCLMVLWQSYQSQACTSLPPAEASMPTGYFKERQVRRLREVQEEGMHQLRAEQNQQEREGLAGEQRQEEHEMEGLPLSTYFIDRPPSEIVESTYECTAGKTVNKICFFNNVFLWQGDVVFVTANASLQLPTKVPIDFRVVSGLAFLRPKIITPEAMAAAMQSAKAIVDWSSAKDEVHVWSGAANNYGHFMGEDMPSLHNTLCKHLGRCAPGTASGLHLVLKRRNMFSWPPYVDRAMACLSESRLVNMEAPELHDTLFIVRRLLLGVGDDCRAAIFCQTYHKTPIAPLQYELYRNRMAQCLGFDASATAPISPKMKLLVVDRLYSSGRHFLNIQEVMSALNERYGGIAEVQLAYMENRTLAEQVPLWNAASVVVHMHGAALGNWGFLPHGAAGVHVTMDTIGNPFPIHFERDLRGVTNVSALLMNVTFHPHVVLRQRQFEKMAEWRDELTVEDKMQILERGSCENLSKTDTPGELSCAIKYLLKGFDLEVPLDQLLAFVDQAVYLVHIKQGAEPPPWINTLPLAAAPGVDGA